jgi:hypothetical protein
MLQYEGTSVLPGKMLSSPLRTLPLSGSHGSLGRASTSAANCDDIRIQQFHGSQVACSESARDRFQWLELLRYGISPSSSKMNGDQLERFRSFPTDVATCTSVRYAGLAQQPNAIILMGVLIYSFCTNIVHE